MATSSSNRNRQLRKSSPNTIHGKLLVGYCILALEMVAHPFIQGIMAGTSGHPRFDLYPDMTSYDTRESYAVPGLTLPEPTGGMAQLFSSRNPMTVTRHFHLMAEHGIDGVFLQRLANECEVDGIPSSPLASLMRISDETLDLVRGAAEAEGRVWALMYDISGVAPRRLGHVLRVDWAHMILHKRILDSPNYLRENGRPVIAMRGVGIKGGGQDLSAWFEIVKQLRSFTPGGAYIMFSGSPYWRTPGQGDQENNPGFTRLYREVDAICPWSVEVVTSEDTADGYADIIREDMKLVKQWNQEFGSEKRLDYIPVASPGLSASQGIQCSNLSGRPYNEIPRRSGNLLWRQVYHCQRAGAHTIFAATFDDFNQGTALMPAVPLARSLPNERKFLALDADGDTSLPPDWYLRICGVAGEAMRGEKRIATDLLPRKELDDYWAMRPKYEGTIEESVASSSQTSYEASGPSSSGDSGSYIPGPPIRSGTIDIDDLPPPPPPYSLESEQSEESEAPDANQIMPASSAISVDRTTAPASTDPNTVNPTPAPSAPPVPSTTQSTRPGSTTPTIINSTLPPIGSISLSDPPVSYQPPVTSSPPTATHSILPVEADHNDISWSPDVPPGRSLSGLVLSGSYQHDQSPTSFPVMSIPGQPPTSPSTSGSSQTYQQTENNRIDPSFFIPQHQDTQSTMHNPDVGGFASPDLIRHYSSRVSGSGMPPPPVHPGRLGTRPNSPPVPGQYGPPPSRITPSATRPYSPTSQASYQGRPQSPPRQDYTYPVGPSSPPFGQPQSSVPAPFECSAYGRPVIQGSSSGQQPESCFQNPSFSSARPYEDQTQVQSYYNPAGMASPYPSPGPYPSPTPPGAYDQQTFPQSGPSYPQWNTASSPPRQLSPPLPQGNMPPWPGGPAPPHNTGPYAPYPVASRSPRPPVASTGSTGSAGSGRMPIPDTIFPRPAMEALDRFGVSEERRRQLEQGVGSVLHTGSKWLNSLRK
ncbi:hypothetical protein FRB96_000105 [Tulasnella sp. 330]|nr:hypothetical protein FRB96_000105 [Tulasnella sp. 330]